MNKAIGIIFGNASSDVLQGLAQDRPIAAIPFGGRYRLLDFALSSMVNSGIRTVGLITPQHYRPMLDHLGAGKDWFLDRKSGGLFILPGAIHGLRGNSQFLIKDIYLNIDFLERDVADNVVISCSDQVFNIDFYKVLERHEQTHSDVTLIYKSMSANDGKGRLKLKVSHNQSVYSISKENEEEEIEEVLEKEDEGKKEEKYFIDILIIRRKLLLEIIEGYKRIETMDLIDAITDNIKIIKVQGYEFSCYLGKIRSIQDYFHRNMDLLNPSIQRNIFTVKHPIYTRIRDNPPTKYGDQAKVKNSLISSGCLIEGEVENSILSRGVIIERGCTIKNCIIMPKCKIGQNSILEQVILDKFVEVNEGNTLKGKESNPLVVYKKAII